VKVPADYARKYTLKSNGLPWSVAVTKKALCGVFFVNPSLMLESELLLVFKL
jgi:hypothetical protein